MIFFGQMTNTIKKDDFAKISVRNKKIKKTFINLEVEWINVIKTTNTNITRNFYVKQIKFY